MCLLCVFFFFFQAEDGIRDVAVTGVQTCALPICVIFPVFGSYMERWRLDWSTGNSLADGWSDPLLQKSGFAGAPTREVNQTRPFSSNIGLCMLVWLSQIGSSPQYGDGVIGFCFDEGVFGSRTGIFTWVALWLTGSSTGKRSRLSSVAP